MIRHARLALAFPIQPLTVAVIEPSFRTLLMAAIGVALLPNSRLAATFQAAIPLPVVAPRTQKEQGSASGAESQP